MAIVQVTGLLLCHTVHCHSSFEASSASISSTVGRAAIIFQNYDPMYLAQMTWLICMALNLPPEAFAAFAS